MVFEQHAIEQFFHDSPFTRIKRCQRFKAQLEG